MDFILTVEDRRYRHLVKERSKIINKLEKINEEICDLSGEEPVVILLPEFLLN